jgi:hypothetical protein
MGMLLAPQPLTSPVTSTFQPESSLIKPKAWEEGLLRDLLGWEQVASQTLIFKNITSCKQ